MVFGYCRVSTKKQSIERQIRNILAEYPDARIIQEVYTGTKLQGRQQFLNLLGKVRQGDTIVFDSVSRMSRSADEGVEQYFDLFDKGVTLIFLKEHYIDTNTYAENLKDKIELTGTDEDEIFKGLNNYFRKLAERQIRIAFQQSEKEVKDLQQRTREGIMTARRNGKRIGLEPGRKLVVKKAVNAKEVIRKHSKTFGGTLSNEECWKLAGCGRCAFYKYRRELLEELQEQEK